MAENSDAVYVYAALTVDGARQVRMQRIAELEAEHYYHALLLDEGDPSTATRLRAKQAEIERRLAVHQEALLDAAVAEHPAGG